MTQTLRVGCCLLAAALVGCGSGGPVKHDVSGSVTWNGTPIEKGDIKFFPADGSGIEEWLPITNGSFSGQISPGDKKVQIMATREVANPTPQDLKAKEAMGMLPRESFIPEEYNVKTVLTATVSAGANKLEFALPQNR